ncbi:MAG: hypothetical protein AAFO62_10120, partial [Pseudomonadota bacterium]
DDRNFVVGLEDRPRDVGLAGRAQRCPSSGVDGGVRVKTQFRGIHGRFARARLKGLVCPDAATRMPSGKAVIA